MSDDGKKVHARYSKVERRVWNDSDGLTPIQPCGQGLWLYLLTTPHLGILPGLVMGGEAMMAEHLGWPIEGFRKAFAEVFAKGMAKADWKARLVVLPKALRRAIKTGSPESPNVVRGWRQQWIEVPDCALKREYYRELKALVEGLGEPFAKAFREAIAEPSRNQEQDQEQEQDPRSPPSGATRADARPPTEPVPGEDPLPDSEAEHYAMLDRAVEEFLAESAPSEHDGPEPLRLAPSETAPTPPRKARRKPPAPPPMTPCPEDFTPTAACFDCGEGLGFSRERVEFERAKFIDHAKAKGRLMVDWSATFRTWLRNAAKYEKQDAQRANGRALPGASTLQPASPTTWEAGKDFEA